MCVFQFPKMDGINWPLTNVPLNRLPKFLNGEKTVHVNKIRPSVARPVRNISGNITGPIPQMTNRITAPLSNVTSNVSIQNQKKCNSGAKKAPAPKPPPR